MLDTAQTNLIGYARVSTDDQDLSLQIAALERFGVPAHRIHREHASGGSMNRPVWRALIDNVQSGETVVVWKLDRLGRTLRGLLQTTERLDKIGASLRTMDGLIDMSSAMGRFNLHIMGAVAELERGLISERTKAGMAEKRAQGTQFGARHMIRDNPKRLAVAHQLQERGLLDQLTARELQKVLNSADPSAKKIGHINTVRIWRRAGYPGLEQ